MFDPFLHIDEYIEGKLTDEQVSLFKQTLSDNVDLQKIVKNYDEAKRLSEGLVELETRQILENVRKEKSEPEKSMIRYLWPVVAVAALLGGIFLLPQLFQQPMGAEELFAQNFNVPQMSMTTKGTNQDSILMLIQGLFNAKAYEESLPKFDMLEQDKEILLYKGINYQVLNQPDSAIKLYNTLSDPTNDIKWYHALAYIQHGAIENAREKLSEIERNSVHYSKSQELLKQLSE